MFNTLIILIYIYKVCQDDFRENLNFLSLYWASVRLSGSRNEPECDPCRSALGAKSDWSSLELAGHRAPEADCLTPTYPSSN